MGCWRNNYDVQFLNNYITNSSYNNGIFIESSYPTGVGYGDSLCKAIGNTVENCYLDGIETSDGQGITISQNYIRNCANGIIPQSFSDGGCNGTIITDNTIQHCTYGMKIDSIRDGVISKNIIQDSAYYAIYATNMNYTEVSSNDIWNYSYGDANRPAIDITNGCSYDTIQDNVINHGGNGTQNILVAILVAGSNIKVVGNTICDSVSSTVLYFGIELSAANYCYVSQNSVTNNTNIDRRIWELTSTMTGTNIIENNQNIKGPSANNGYLPTPVVDSQSFSRQLQPRRFHKS